MRRGATAALLLSLLATPAWAQVSVNPGALDLLPSAPARGTAASRPAPTHSSPAHTARHGAPEKKPGGTAEHAASSGPAAPTPAKPPTAAPAAAAKPALPVIPPAIAALPPPAPVPAPRPQQAPVVTVVADAPGAATPLPNGVRVTFGTDRQDLNPATESALRDLARRVKPDETGTINIYAYASGTPDDASVGRRLALARALAARAVLINSGIPSTRIYPRALGAAGGDADKDRVDVMTGAPGTPAAAPPVLPATGPTAEARPAK